MNYQEIIAGMGDEHRSVLELRFFAGAGIEEMSEILCCSSAEVRARLHRALEELLESRRTGWTGSA